MKKIIVCALGVAFLVSGFLMFDNQALTALGLIEDQISTDRNGLIISVHNRCHDDCQKDSQGFSHWHGGMNCRKISCPGGKK